MPRLARACAPPPSPRSTPHARAATRVNAKLMDTNGDGVVSRAEWDTYHANAWTDMKPTGAGVSTADIDRMNRMHTN